MATKTFKCGCGELKFTLHGSPWLDANCHCHSCVASSRFIHENHGKEKNGTIAIESNGGSVFSMYRLAKVDFPDDVDPRENLGCVKVGDKGKMLRYYTKCCGTQVFTVTEMGTDPGFNRNAIYEGNLDDETKYIPTKTPINIMTKYAFGPKEDIPDPKAEKASMGMIAKFLPKIISSSMGFGKGKNKFRARKEDLERAEVVPITWEE